MSSRFAPTINADNAFFWNGLREDKLLLQRCASCASLRNPPQPMCPTCNSFDWDTITSSGRGTVYSFVVPTHPAIPHFDDPPIVVLVELEEGVRMVSNLCDIAPQDVAVGMPVQVFYQRFDNDVVLHQFRPVKVRGA